MIVWALVGTLVMGLIVTVILVRMAFMWVMDFWAGDNDEEAMKMKDDDEITWKDSIITWTAAVIMLIVLIILMRYT